MSTSSFKFPNPAPLGLAGFGLTTWLLSMINAGIFTGDSLGLVLACAFAFGGTAQMIAGVMEVPRGNTFGFTAFCGYGAFWWSFALFVVFFHGKVPGTFVGWYLLLWGVFTFYLWLATFRASRVLQWLFLLLWIIGATTEDQRKGLADYFSPNNLMSHASSGTGQPFGGHTAFDQGALVSDRGSVLITAGKRPVIDRTEDGDDPIYSDYHRAKTGDGQGAGPMPDDQDADDSTSDKPLGQSGTPEELLEHYKLTAPHVAAAARRLLGGI